MWILLHFRAVHQINPRYFLQDKSLQQSSSVNVDKTVPYLHQCVCCIQYKQRAATIDVWKHFE